MEATKQAKFDELVDKCIDMSKVKLDTLKAQINTKIHDIFKIEDFVNNELKLEKLMCPMKLHIHLTEFLNGPLVKQFICELWTILLVAEESAAAKANDAVESKEDEIRSEVIRTKHIEPTKNEILKKVFQTKIRKDAERNQSQSKNLDNKVSGRTKSLTSLSNFRSTQKPQRRIDIKKDNKHSKKPVEYASLTRSTNSQNSGTRISSNSVQKRKQPLLANKTFSSSLKPQRRIDISKVKLDLLKPWICKKIADILQREDNAAIEFVYNKLKQDKMLCPQKLQIRIAGFLNGGKAQKFVCDLWPLLLSAQLSESGIPAELMQQKKEEIGRIEKDIKHEGFSPLHSRSQSSQNKDGRGVVTCGLDGFANICVYSPQLLRQTFCV